MSCERSRVRIAVGAHLFVIWWLCCLFLRWWRNGWCGVVEWEGRFAGLAGTKHHEGREGRCAELALGVAAREVQRGMRM